MKLKKLLCLIIIFLVNKPFIDKCLSQVNFDTTVDYNNGAEFPYSIYQVADSGYIFITSGNNQIEFNKLKENGSVSFQKTFGLTNTRLYVGLSNSLKPTYDGGFVFGGGVQYLSSSTNAGDGMLVKYDSNADTEFVKILGDTTWESIYDCIQTSDSGFALAGIKHRYLPINNDYWIVKTDQNGNVLWARNSLNTGEETFHLIENWNHEIVVSGAKKIANSIHCPFIVTYDLQGNLVSTKSFNYGAFICAAGAINRYGTFNYALTGCLDTIINNNDYSYPEYLAKTDSNFNIIWKTIFNSPEKINIYINKEISDQGIVLVGFKHDSVTGFTVGWIAKIDSNGSKVWEHFYKHGPSYNYFSDFQETFDHGFVICGTTWGGSSQDSWIVKLDSNGCLDTSCGLNTGTVELFYSQNSLDIFPNPSTAQVTINYKLMPGKEGKLSIFSMLGEKIKEQVLFDGSKQIEINIDHWAKGIYLCIVESKGNILKGKLIKE